MRYGDDEEANKDEITDSRTELALSLSQQAYTGQLARTREQVSQFTGTNYLAIHTKGMVASSSKVAIHDKRKAADDEEEDDHGLADKNFRWWSLLDEPNPWQTQEQLLYEIVQQLSLHGTSMIWNVKNGWGKTVWRFMLPMSLVTPIQSGRRADIPYGGVHINPSQWCGGYGRILSNAFTKNGWSDRDISFEDITMTSFPHPVLRGDGHSPTTAIVDWIDIVDNAQKSALAQYDRGPNMRVLIAYDGPETHPTTEQLNACQRKYEARFKDSECNVVVVPPNTNTQNVTLDPESMQYVQTIESLNEWILAGHGVSKSIIGMNEGATYGSNAANQQAFNANILQPLLDFIAAEDTATMKKEEGPAFYIKYIAGSTTDKELEQRDKELEVQKASIAMTMPFLKVNEVRKMLGLKRDDNPGGEKYIGEITEATGGGTEPGGTVKPPQAPGQQLPTGMIGTPKLLGNSQPGVSEAKTLPRYEAITKSMFRESSMVVSDYGERAPVIAFDLDGTLAQSRTRYVRGIIGEPVGKMIELTRLVKEAGCNVVVYTARNEDRAVAKWLDSNGVPWCGINENPYIGQSTDGAKMLFDVLVDDRVTTARTTEGVVMQGIVDNLSPYWGGRVLDQMEKSSITDRYGYLFAPIGGKLAEKLREVQSTIDPSHLAGKEIESELHVTILYGMIGDYEGDLPRIFGQMKRPSFKLKRDLTTFGGGAMTGTPGDQVALVVELEGEELQSLHSVAAKSFAHHSTHPTYRPHITLAYIKGEYEDRYIDNPAPKASSKIEKLVYRHQSFPDMVVPLRD